MNESGSVGAVALFFLSVPIAIIAAIAFSFGWSAVKEWQTLIGASIAVLAALATIWNVQRQISVQQDIAGRVEIESFEVVRQKLAAPLGILNGFWRAIDRTLDQELDREAWMHYAVTAIGLYEPALFIEKISQFQGGLNPSKRAKLSFVLDELSWLAAHQKQFMRQLTVNPDFINEYAIFRNQLSNLDIRLKDFDGDSALIFADRTKTPRMEPSWEYIFKEQEANFQRLIAKGATEHK